VLQDGTIEVLLTGITPLEKKFWGLKGEIDSPSKKALSSPKI